MIIESSNKTNVFGLNNPHLFTCKVKAYDETFATMCLQIWNDENNSGPYYIYFGGITYFSAPMLWKNANFETGTLDERFQLWKLSHPHLPDKRIYQMAKTYESYFIKDTLYSVQIAAISASFSATAPGD